MSLAVVELQPGKALLHRHIQTEEIYYILAGAGIIHLDKIYRLVGHGDAVYSGGMYPCVENPSAETLRYLAISAPGFDPADMQFY
jgi:mannose-6-phosphate isomerase-like protein (cupin superfamily)